MDPGRKRFEGAKSRDVTLLETDQAGIAPSTAKATGSWSFESVKRW